MTPNKPLKARLFHWGATTVAWAGALFAAFPVYWMAKGSLETTEDLLVPHLLPQNPTLDNFRSLGDTDFVLFATNSLVVALLSTLMSMALATMAGYGLARFKFRGQAAVARSVLFVYMFPALALAIPLYSVFFDLGLTNSRFGLALAHTSLSLPFGIWLLWQFFQTVPRAYQESAYTLGAGRIRTFLEVDLPQVRSGLIAFGIFAFALSWEDYTFAFVLSTEVTSKTLPVGVAGFVERDLVPWGLIQTAGVLMTIPALLIILFFQRYLIRGMGAGGMKG